MEKYVYLRPHNSTDAAVIRTLKSGLSATYKNNYLETKLNDMSGNVDNGISDSDPPRIKSQGALIRMQRVYKPHSTGISSPPPEHELALGLATICR